jgi:hypothetical protein
MLILITCWSLFMFLYLQCFPEYYLPFTIFECILVVIITCILIFAQFKNHDEQVGIIVMVVFMTNLICIFGSAASLD